MTHATATATHRTTTTDTATLTPARKRLIRQAYRDLGIERALDWLAHLPSFAGISRGRIQAWATTLPNVPGRPTKSLEQKAPAKPCQPRKQAGCAFEEITQAPDEPATGEWYSVLAIASGLGIGRERVYGWMQFGWLRGGPLFTAADIRAFVRTCPLEVVHLLMDHERTAADVEMCWLWLVSVLAGSREGA